jgi:hypothetical protein
MIGFITTSIAIRVNYNSSQLMAVYDSLHSLLDYKCLLFHWDEWWTKNLSRMNSAERQSQLLYDWRVTANQFVLAPSPLRHTARFFSSQLNTCGHSPYITSSLTREWVYHLQMLLALASAFILGSESRGTRVHILLSQIRDFPFCRLIRPAGLGGFIRTPLHTRGILAFLHL